MQYGIGAALSAATFVGVLLWLSKKNWHDAISISWYVLPAALVFARLFYCLARFNDIILENGIQHFFTAWKGGYMMWGALTGAALGALASGKKSGIGDTCDKVAVAALASLAPLRMFLWFTEDGRGIWLEDPGFFGRFPFAVTDGYGEWQLAVFVWEAFTALVILAALFAYKGTKGDKALLALIAYSAAQIIFDSLKKDTMPRWGFVCVSQAFSAAAFIGACLLRNVRIYGKRRAFLRMPALLICVAAVAGLEWAIDKTAVPLTLCYAGICAAILLGLCGGIICQKRLNAEKN